MRCRPFPYRHLILVFLILSAPALAQPGITRTTRFSADGRAIASASTNEIDIWSVADGRLLRQMHGHTHFVNALAITPDGRTLASASYDTTVRLWDAETGKERHLLKGPEKAVAYIAVSPDGKTVAAGGYDKIIWLWDIATGKEIRRFTGSQGDILFVGFSRDGKTLASSGCEHVIRLWDVATGAQIRQLVGNTHNVRTFTFAPDGKTGISGGCDHSVRLWDLSNGKESRQFVGHTNDVFFVTLSPDGQTLASASQDGSVRLWNAATGAELRRCPGHQGGVICIAFSADGRTLTSGGYDKVQRICEIATGKERLLFGEPGANPAAAEPARAELDKSTWQDLASEDAHRAHRASWALARSDQALAFVRERLKPVAVAGVDLALAKRLIADLDNDQFKVREKAMDDLAKLGPSVAPLLKTALSTDPGTETRRRIERLLVGLTGADLAGEELRGTRVVEALEYIGTKDAAAVIQALAQGSAESELTRQARAALGRLARPRVAGERRAKE
jgi:dipeptidyl aminopeptidase/acylaminoacyl peptidase